MCRLTLQRRLDQTLGPRLDCRHAASITIHLDENFVPHFSPSTTIWIPLANGPGDFQSLGSHHVLNTSSPSCLIMLPIIDGRHCQCPDQRWHG